MFLLDALLEGWLWFAGGWAPFFFGLTFRFWLGFRATRFWRRRTAATGIFIIAAIRR
jgi:hypothetical protein